VNVVSTELFLRDVFELPESVHAGDFKIELSGGFTETDQRVSEYVVTPQLREAFGEALSIVKAAVRTGSSYAAYLHGSFGSGKSHFMTVLHAVLANEPVTRAKPGLREVIADHDDWLRALPGRGFLMVPYHLVGATDIGSAILGGYVNAVRRQRPQEPTPPVYKADALLEDARRQRAFLADDARFAAWLGEGAGTPGCSAADDDDLDVIGTESVATWSTEELDRAFASPAGDPVREALVSALLSGPMSAYAHRAAGDASAFIPLEDGLSVMARHARQLGYAGIVLFLDELILWLQAHMANQEFVNTQVSNLVKLIESGNADRALPIVSFISRQRDLSQLVGADVTGADVKNLEAQVQYLAARFDVVNLEDRNLPAIIKERVLKVRPGAGRAAIDEAFAAVESANAATRDVLLDPAGATGATWAEFKDVYPLSPALLNVLVALSGALQRERTGLKLLQELLFRRRDDMRLGQLIPLGDLWDVLSGGTGEAFTDRLKQESDAAQRFYAKARAYLLAKYGSETDDNFRADDRFVKTLLLAALAPDVPALTRLTGARLAALNHGSIRTRIGTPGAQVVSRMRQLQAELGELRHDGEQDPVFSLHLTDLDLEPLLDAVNQQDSPGARRVWVKDQLWQALGAKESGQFVCEREVVWRGSRRTVELVFANVREGDTVSLADQDFLPLTPGHVRVVFDFPFDTGNYSPADDADRLRRLKPRLQQPATVVWLPHFFSDQRLAQLGRLLKMNYLLERDRLADYAGHLGAEDQVKVRHQLLAQRDTLTSQLGAVLRQLYGIEAKEEVNTGAEVPDAHVLPLMDGVQPRLLGGAGFEDNLLALTDAVLAALYPKHPDLDPGVTRKAVTIGELRAVRGWITKAMESGERHTTLQRSDLPLARRIAPPLELGQVHDGPLTVSGEWRTRIDRLAAQHDATGDLDVEAIRRWIAQAGWTGLDEPVIDLIISTYALLADRAWVLNGTVENEPPELGKLGPGWRLRAQELPTAEEYAAARQRAATLFGLRSSDQLFARNVARLAADVRRAAAEVESDVVGLRQALDRHAVDLGLATDGATPARIVSAEEAADLVAHLRTARDSTAVLRCLAQCTHTSSDQVLSAALRQAGSVLSALEDVQWRLLDSATRFVSRQDTVGERARRLLADVARTAAAAQFERQLEPVLRALNTQAVALVEEAARLTAVATPVAVPAPPPQGAVSSGQISLTDTGEPPVPSADPPQVVTSPAVPADPERPAAGGGGRRRVRSSTVQGHLSRLLGEVGQEIEEFRSSHPGVDIEITWHAVPADTAGESTAP
jgi:hypothetical protein